MKFSIKYAVFSCIISFSTTLFPYAFVHNSDSVIPAVDIYVAEGQSAFPSYLNKLGVDSKVIDVIELVGKGGSTIGTVLAGPTEGVSEIVGETVEILAALSKVFNEVALPIVRSKSFSAYHHNVPKGNQGRHAEWNWSSIKSQEKLDKGDQMFFWVTEPDKLVPLFQGVIGTDEVWPFTIIRDSSTGELKAIYEDKGEYTQSTY